MAMCFKKTNIILQTLQGKDLILLKKNIILGGKSSVMGDRYVISDDNKKILNTDAINLYGDSLSQVLPDDQIEMWHCHPDLHKKELEEFFKHSWWCGHWLFCWSWFKLSLYYKTKNNTFYFLSWKQNCLKK